MLLPFYTRVLSPEDYGVMDIIAIFGTIVGVICTLEIAQAASRFYPEATDTDSKVGYASTTLIFTLVVYTLYTSVLVVLADPISKALIQKENLAVVFRVASISLYWNGLFSLVQSQLRWKLQAKLYAFCNLTFTLVSVFACVTFVLFMKMGIIGFFFGSLIGGVTGTTLSLYCCRDVYAFKFDFSKFKEMLLFSLPLVPSSILVITATYVDRFAINALMTISDVGIYGLGYRVSSVINLVMAGVQTSLAPLIITRYKEPGAPAEMARIFRYFMAFSLALYLVLALFSYEIFYVFTHVQYHRAHTLVPVLVPAFFLSNMYVFAPGIGIAKKIGTFVIINIFVSLMNIFLNFILIPHVGVSGAAIASSMSGLCCFLLLMIQSQRLYYVPHKWLRILLPTIMVSILVSASAIFPESINVTSIVIKTGMLLAAVPIVVYMILGFEEIKRVRQRLLEMAH